MGIFGFGNSWFFGVMFTRYLLQVWRISRWLNGLYCFVKGYRLAKLFVIAWSFLFAGAAIHYLRLQGVLPSVFFTKYALQISSVIEVLLLSLLISDLVKTSQRQALDTQRAMDKLKQEFIYAITHDIKNQIVGLKLHLTQEVGKAERFAPVFDALQSLLTRFKSTLANNEDHSSSDLRQLFDEIVASFSLKIRLQNCKLTLSYADDITFQGNLSKLQLCVNNIIDNAMDVSANGVVEVSCSMSLGWFEVRIADSGPGFDGVVLDKEGGTGQGLKLTKRLVEPMHGRMQVTSLSKGGVVTLGFPG